ncbi:MAG TPA: DUF416 family protein [Gemmatimonadales bacterium]|nr:DUF416 family protein [Gemmatimonadales bacterium]
MVRERLDTLDDYDRHLNDTLARWPRERRTAFAAAMADRWLPVYSKFSKREDWGDPMALRQAIDAVWRQVRGEPLTSRDRGRHLTLVRDVTPHMDDFDAPEALAAAVMVQEALESCASADNVGPTMQASLSGFEAVMPDWSMDPESQPRLWQRAPVRKEMEKQLEVLDRIGGIAAFDEATVDAFRRELSGAALAGAVPRARPPSAPPLRTNQDVFEQYRAIVEQDTRGRRDDDMPGVGPATLAMLWFAEWAGRYKRRLDLASGNYGKLADGAGQAALVRRQHARDRSEPTPPDWTPEVREMVDLILATSGLGLDVRSVHDLHGYGPSVRMLWASARRAGRSEREAWREIVDWARHRPAGWDEEDRRKKKGRAHANPELATHLGQTVEWTATEDFDYPWAAAPGGSRWRVRLNDFPDEIMYTLIVEDRPVGDFHDWPDRWRRP